jgi:hypothetical protein
MDIIVTLRVKVDLDVWQDEYGSDNTVHALKEALSDLSEPGWYLQGEKWSHGLGDVTQVTATVDLDGRAS